MKLKKGIMVPIFFPLIIFAFSACSLQAASVIPSAPPYIVAYAYEPVLTGDSITRWKMRIEWERVNINFILFAGEYVIYRSAFENGIYTQISVVQGYFFYDEVESNQTSGREYFYRIAARNNHGSSAQSKSARGFAPALNINIGDNGYKAFWARDLNSASLYYRTWAKREAEGAHGIIYQELQNYRAGSPAVNNSRILSIKTEFDIIYDKLTQVFGQPEYKIAPLDGNNKITILLLNIQDGYVVSGNPYVSGYFFSRDLHVDPPAGRSNERNMIYIDTYPAFLYAPEIIYRTMAHEFQHLINYTLHPSSAQMDLWINEGLSEAATYIYDEKINLDRINYYNRVFQWPNQPPLTIPLGNTFFSWDYQRGDVLANYSTVYLFFQWLRIHANMSIYGDIINSNFTDHRSVVEAFNAKRPASPDLNWEDLLMNWFAANFIQNGNGILGYGNSGINLVKHTANVSANTLRLAPGEGVVTQITSSVSLPANRGNIRYALLNNNTASKISSAAAVINSPGSYLLTFNVDTNLKNIVIQNGVVARALGQRTLAGAVTWLAGNHEFAYLGEVPQPWEWDSARYFLQRLNDDF